MALQIFVKSLKGNTITLDVNSNDTIHDIKQKIHDRENFPVAHQILTFSGKKLLSEHTVTRYGIIQNSTLILIVKRLSANIRLSICDKDKSHKEIPITSLTTLAEFKKKCIADELIQAHTKILVNDEILQNDDIRMMDIKNWKTSIFHTRSVVTLDDIKGVELNVFRNKIRIHSSSLQKLPDKKALISTLIYDYLESTGMDPLFYSGYPPCPFQEVSVRFNGLQNLLRLQNIYDFFEPFVRTRRGYGTIPALPLHSSCAALSGCDCQFGECSVFRIRDDAKVIYIDISLPDFAFFFGNYYYANGKFYKKFNHNKKTLFDLHFCPTQLPKPLKLTQPLLVHGYVRSRFRQYCHVTSVDLISLIHLFLPQILGCQYEVSECNERLSDKLEQKTNVFEIDGLQCYLKYIGDYEQTFMARKGLYLVLQNSDDNLSITDLTFVCRLYCKTTKQRYSCIEQTNLLNSSGNLLVDFGSASSLESIVCNITVLNRLKSDILYEYPLQITPSDYLMEWTLNKETFDSIKEAIYGDSPAVETLNFESKIFYDMFVLRCGVMKDTLHIELQLIALPQNKRNEDGLVTKCRIRPMVESWCSDEFEMIFDYTRHGQVLSFDFSNMIGTIREKNVKELTIKAKIEITEPIVFTTPENSPMSAALDFD